MARLPLLSPGEYTLTLEVGDQTFTRTLAVERVGDLTGDSTPFEESWEREARRWDRPR